jgi:predicted Na+-dependent transporter
VSSIELSVKGKKLFTMGFDSGTFVEITSSVLLFCLVFGMSATVDIFALRAQLKNTRAILTGLFLQFVILPFAGFVVVRALNLGHPTGVTLLVVTSSPGGSYSNWWCSMFNADLALSVTMTAASTLLSTIMLPVNLFIYARISYDDDIVSALDWGALAIALAIVIIAIGSGLAASAHFHSHNFNLHANRLGNFSGIALVLFSAVMSNSDSDSRLWDRDWKFFVGVALPCIMGLVIANLMSTGLGLLKPERVTVSIECCYQNVGIATSVALAMFDGDDQAEAVSVPFYYGIVEAVILLIYCVGAWKAAWTKAPADVSFWQMITTSYEILVIEKVEDKAAHDDDFLYVEHKDADPSIPTDGTEMVRTDVLPTSPKEPSYMHDVN